MLFESLGRQPRRRPRRTYQAAAVNRLTADWLTTILSADEEARRSLRTLRARSRQLWMNNDYAKGFLRRLQINVVGPQGIFPQLMINDTPPTVQNPKPPRDRFAEGLIEREFKKWGKKESASVTGDQSIRDLQKLYLHMLASDGEVLVEKVRGFDNPHGFALRFLEADHLDEDLNHELPNGNRIRMGVEINRWHRPVAYHILSTHPGDFTHMFGGRRFVRVLARDMHHGFMRHRAQQTRGVPWMHTAMTRLNMLGAYEEAELVASRMASSKMGVYTEEEGEFGGTDVDVEAGESVEEGGLLEDFEPGVWQKLPPGIKADLIEPTHPTDAFGDFMKQMLRGAASGLGLAYTSLASDLEGVNFSSGRMGLSEERDFYRDVQMWFVEHFLDEIFGDWLRMSILQGAINLPIEKMDKFNVPRWQKRGWPWVDPQKETKANTDAINAGIKTRRAVISEQGDNLEDVFQQLADENQLAKDLGLEFKDSPPTVAGRLADIEGRLDDDDEK